MNAKRSLPKPAGVVALLSLCGVVLCLDSLALPQYDPHDPIDMNFGVREALERVERVCVCHEGDGEADRRRTVRLLCDLESRRDADGCYRRLGDWVGRGIDGGERGFQFACASLFRLAGELYGYDEFAATGRKLEAQLLASGPETAFRDEVSLPPAVRRYLSIMAESREDLRCEIRPGGRDGRPFWNGRARVFMYPPAFDFKRVEGAAGYRFIAIDDVHATHQFTSANPTASLAPVWAELPVGLQCGCR